MTTFASALSDLRSRLDEKTTARYWSDADLINWLSQGCRDIARRTETLAEYSTSIVAYPGNSDYPWPADALRLHRVEYVPINSANPPDVYPLEMSTIYEMDQRWGSQPYTQSVNPAWCVVGRGTPGNPRNNGSGVPIFSAYPVPSQAGYFRVWYWALPKTNPASTDNMEVSLGYEDIPLFYAEALALRADNDPRWSESMQLYEAALAHMIEMTRTMHDQGRSIVWSNGSGYGNSGFYGGY